MTTVPSPGPLSPEVSGKALRRGLAWSTSGNVALRVGNLLVGIIMARLIAPEAFGLFAIGLTVWTVLGSIAEFGLGADLVRRDDYERHIPTVATLGAVLSIGLAVAMFVAAEPIAAAFGSVQATGIVQLMAVPLALIGLSVVPAAILQRRIAQGTVFAIDGSALVLSTTAVVVFILIGVGPAALALGRIIGQSWTVLLQYAAVRRWPVFGWDREVAREALGFGLPLALANAVSWLILSVDNLVVARTLGPEALGLYALAFNIASWPMSIAGQSVRVIALPAFSRLPDDRRRGRAMERVSGLVWSLGLLSGLGVLMLAPQLVDVLYGARWGASVVAVVPLAAMGAFRVIFDLCATYLVAAGRTGRVFAVQLIWVVLLVPALIAGVALDGIAGAGWAHLAVSIVVVLPAYLVAMRTAGVRPLPFLREWLAPTAAALPVAAVLWLVALAVPLPVLALLVGGVAGTAVYAALLFRWFIARVRGLRDMEARPPSTRQAPLPSRP